MTIKRRTFSLLAGTSVVALMVEKRQAFGQATDSDFATLSKTTLTPVGAERAGNAAGTIPAWTGGMTSIPAGIDWDPDQEMPPDFWADEKPLYTINSSNMAQYADLLTDGVQTLIQKQGMTVPVYQTHRTAAAPQWVYDNILANSSRAQLSPAGGRFGFTGGYGGIPFPIPDASNPLNAGAQVMWNHSTRWQGSSYVYSVYSWAISSGTPQITVHSTIEFYSPYYQQNGTYESFNGKIYDQAQTLLGPATITGVKLLAEYSTNPYESPDIVWEVLPGQGRVRKAPELSYDTPSSYADGIANYDEYYGFLGALDRYDWKFIEKKEMLIPYNNNGLLHMSDAELYGAKFLNGVRWELHRVWVVDATLHPGERNVLARRMIYVDEDTWVLALADCWDASGSIYKLDMTVNGAFPNLPGTLLTNHLSYNLQTGDYTVIGGPFGSGPWVFKQVQMSFFEPQAMAAAAAY